METVTGKLCVNTLVDGDGDGIGDGIGTCKQAFSCFEMRIIYIML